MPSKVDKRPSHKVLDGYDNERIMKILQKDKENSRVLKYFNKETWAQSREIENVLLESSLKIIDFGLGKDLKDSEGVTTSVCGSPVTMAPEIWMNKIQTKKKEGYNYKVDIWSTGCLLFNLLTNSPPFPGEEIETICNKVVYSGEYFLPLVNEDGSPSEVTVEYVDMLHGMLQYHQEIRFSWEEVIKHPFLNRYLKHQIKLTDLLDKLPKEDPLQDKIKKNSKGYQGIRFHIKEKRFLLALPQYRDLLNEKTQNEDDDKKHDFEFESFLDPLLENKFMITNSIEDYFGNSNDSKDEFTDLFNNYDVLEDFVFVFQEDEDGYVIVDQKKRKGSGDS